MLAKCSLLTLLLAIAASIMPTAPVESDDESQAVVPAEMSDAELAAWLREMWHKWQMDSKYKANYVFYRGRIEVEPGFEMSSFEFSSEIVLPLEGKGIVCKDGYLYRVSCDFDPEPMLRELEFVPEGVPDTVVAVDHHDFDDATDGALHINSYPSYEPENDLTIFGVQSAELQAHEGYILPRPGMMIMVYPNPTLPVPGTFAYPQEYPQCEPADYEVTWIGDDRVRLLARHELDYATPVLHTYTVDWWLTPEVPVVERAHSRMERLEDGSFFSEEEIRYADFRVCDGLLIPASILHVTHGDRSPDAISVEQSILDDLGQVAPTEKDFEMPIDPDADILLGLREPLRFREAELISIVELTADDLLKPSDEGHEASFREIPDRSLQFMPSRRPAPSHRCGSQERSRRPRS